VRFEYLTEVNIRPPVGCRILEYDSVYSLRYATAYTALRNSVCSVQNMIPWRVLVDTVINIHVPENAGSIILTARVCQMDCCPLEILT
jgi:hypothetical protein